MVSSSLRGLKCIVHPRLVTLEPLIVICSAVFHVNEVDSTGENRVGGSSLIKLSSFSRFEMMCLIMHGKIKLMS